VLDVIRAAACDRGSDEPERHRDLHAQLDRLRDDSAQFWALEAASAERRKLLAQLFDRAWQDDGTIVAAKPRAPFARYLATVAGLQAEKKNLKTPSGVSR